jgi:hypothetical protein
MLLNDAGATLGAGFDAVTVGDVLVSDTWTDNLDGSYSCEIDGYQATLNYQGGDGNDLTLAVIVAPVPEPGTWAMMFGGLGVLALAQRRRRGYPRPAPAPSTRWLLLKCGLNGPSGLLRVSHFMHSAFDVPSFTRLTDTTPATVGTPVGGVPAGVNTALAEQARTIVDGVRSGSRTAV